MSKTILVTGGTGLLGKPLTSHLLEKGYTIHLLSRSDRKSDNVNIKTFTWDVYKREIDPKCINGIDAVIHLSGENIAEKPWTKERKKKIIESRTQSIGLIYDLLRKTKDHQCKAVISASAIGFYSDRGDEVMTEKDKPGNNFLAQSCIAWERAADEGNNLQLRVVKFRTGVVLSADGGAYPQLNQLVKSGFGASLGSGKQWFPWIHIRDVIRMYDFALENEQLKGVYNMAAPNPVTNKELTKAIAKKYKKLLWLPNVPAFVLRVLMGEMSIMVLGSTRTAADKIQKAGFTFDFLTIDDALKNIE